MSAPLCTVCLDTGSKSQEIDGFLDCVACNAVTNRLEMQNYLAGLSPLMNSEQRAWAAYNFGMRKTAAPVVPAGQMPPDNDAMISASLGLSPWLAAALDDPDVCEEYKTAITAWFNAAMPSATIDAFHARILDTNHILEGQLAKVRAPVVPVAAQPVVPEGWKLVPEAPTPKMVDATWNDSLDGMSHNARNKKIYGAMLAAAPQPAASVTDVAKDAARYRWLRDCDWFSSELCVLRNPKKVLTTGSGLGADCPSRFRLDEAIDAAIAAQQGEKT